MKTKWKANGEYAKSRRTLVVVLVLTSLLILLQVMEAIYTHSVDVRFWIYTITLVLTAVLIIRSIRYYTDRSKKGNNTDDNNQ